MELVTVATTAGIALGAVGVADKVPMIRNFIFSGTMNQSVAESVNVMQNKVDKTVREAISTELRAEFERIKKEERANNG